LSDFFIDFEGLMSLLSSLTVFLLFFDQEVSLDNAADEAVYRLGDRNL
jgi:hypothetical protein